MRQTIRLDLTRYAHRKPPIFVTMSQQVRQLRLGNYAMIVFHERAEITYFSAWEQSGAGKTPILMWKRDAGFRTRLVMDDPASDLEIGKPLNHADFPINELLSLLREKPEGLSRELLAQLIDLIAGSQKASNSPA